MWGTAHAVHLPLGALLIWRAPCVWRRYQLPDQIVVQLFVSMAIAEGMRARVIYGQDRPAGDHGLDPLGIMKKIGASPEAAMKLKTGEIRNGRLAMIAFVGMVAQEAVTGHIWPLM